MSNLKIYVGNLAYSVTSSVLEEFFREYGNIDEVKLIIDRVTNRSKGFAFITYKDEQSARNALEADGKELEGRVMRVNMAREDGSRRGRQNRGYRREDGGDTVRW